MLRFHYPQLARFICRAVSVRCVIGRTFACVLSFMIHHVYRVTTSLLPALRPAPDKLRPAPGEELQGHISCLAWANVVLWFPLTPKSLMKKQTLGYSTLTLLDCRLL